MAEARILVVEDELIVAKDIQNRLESLGYTVPAVAGSGEEAIERAAETHPDLVLMDIRLKGEMDGVEAAQQMRDRFNIPVVYVTAHADADTLRRAKITKPFGYILKPFETRELHTAIEMALRQHQMETKLRESERWLSTVLNSIGDAVIVTDKKGFVTGMNPVAEALTGWKQEEAVGRDLREVFSTADDEGRTLTECPVTKARREHVVVSVGNHATLITKGGAETPIDESAAPLIDDHGTVTGAVLVFRDITERKRAEEELRRLNRKLEKEHREVEALNLHLEDKVKERTVELRLANQELRERNRQLMDARAQAATDGLTGLSNHRAFQEKVKHEVSQAHAHGGNLGLIMMDIDVFKRVNDSLGHMAGDRILREVATVLTETVGQEHAYRYGGDEFAVLLPETDRLKTARVAQRLRRDVAKRTDGRGEKVTVTLGVASVPHTAGSADELIYGADAAMYWAKSAGKNQVGDWGKLIRRREDGTLPWYAADRGVKAPDVVAALVAALAAKDPITSAHTERCSWYTARLAKEIGLKDDETSIVRLASLLHDVGKLAVPDDVLSKPGPLNEEEWAQMKRHPTSALHVLSQIHSIADATPAILHHHEHFNGSGYPDGLAGKEIPIASRILLVTDAFDAMTTDRPYRKAMPIEAAVEELKRNSGTQFDPMVVEAFLRILARDGAQPLRGTARVAAKQAVTTVRHSQDGAKNVGAVTAARGR